MPHEKNISDVQNADSLVNGIHGLSCMTTAASACLYVAAVFPFTNLAFGALAYTVGQRWDENITFLQAYENGMENTGMIFLASACMALATHPSLQKGVRSVGTFFSTSSAPEKDTISNEESIKIPRQNNH